MSDGGVRFLEGAGTRGTLELIGEEVLALLREGMPAEQIALVAPSLERWRAPVETVFSSLGIPYAIVSSRTRRVPVAFQYASESDRRRYPLPANVPIEGGPSSTGGTGGSGGGMNARTCSPPAAVTS